MQQGEITWLDATFAELQNKHLIVVSFVLGCMQNIMVSNMDSHFV
jgi:hypothetical protein